ncbi:disulfide bond formation family protein [Ehrlichia chaffeensis str. Arkansas]|uniref:Disulfide bond formation family protein n=1 Tax=Ehrlichia chaffeensis (strain ATCC CRL-10679 / Arkansas) TaxID=205920 RepID=Q2GFW4_EHRCR|nr:disulfide bond formation protein B [Ehrlichia chaffeensis]ABD44712.1 disulfide bond formation family protein [Ehrlichia chaffeensis str. Arkansas]AHX07189.1 disulfide bond formation DsbB family protein [Ehrlichia chaffeensis str. Osceola]
MVKNYSVILLFIASIVALGVAYIAQYLFGMLPCKLCIYERIPYFITVGLFILYLFKSSKVIFFIMCLCYICNICISGYHVALEHSWVADIIGCTDSIKSLNFDDLKNALLDVNVVISCNRPSIVFIGLSMAECNLIYCVLCLVLSVYLFVKQYVTKR